MTAHTPGPWALTPCGDSAPWLHMYCSDSKGPWHKDRSDEEKIANSVLAMAAPELLEAAKALVDRWDTPNWKSVAHTGEYIAKLRAAIAKAEGRA